MRRMLTICALGAVCAALALAESWTGLLIDGACYASKKDASVCAPAASTTTFALVAAGKVYNFDDAGNAKAAEAMKSRADRSADPNRAAASGVAAKVTGTNGPNNTLKVETIEVQ
ncbi:MAG TPA: hypothetical protein VMJ75_05630 [Candidatus Acidoferrales bacterium]|nr:hypothetical protein [Candidatus Acidoferrales bacterium]